MQWLSPEKNYLHKEASANGDGETLKLFGRYSLACVYIKGGDTRTLTWQGSIDGVNFQDIEGTRVSSGLDATTATAEELYRVDLTGLYYFKAPLSSLSGTSPSLTATAILYGSV